MTSQPSLPFDRALAQPIARRRDPSTSHAAAKEITQSGVRGRQHQEVLDLVRKYPGALIVVEAWLAAHYISTIEAWFR